MPLALALPGWSVSITHFSLPTNGLLGSIATGPDGDIWVTDYFFNAVFQLTTKGVPLQRLGVNNMPLVPTHGMVAGPDGNLWLTTQNPGVGGAIARLTLKGEVTYFPLVGGPFDGPGDIAVGPDGNPWFTESTGKIGRISPAGEIVEFPVSARAITTGPDGNLWYTNRLAIGRMSLQGATQEYPIPWNNPSPLYIVSGPDGNLWFTDTTGRIGSVTTSGAFRSFSVPGAHAPEGLAAGRDGKLWFTTGAGAQLGSITVQGDIAMYVASTEGAVDQITAGPDGNLWFTETGADYTAVGRATLDSSCVPTPLTLCLDDQPGDSRWQIEAAFQTQQGTGSAGFAHALSLASQGVSQGGLFWFFASANPEVLVKVVDGCSINNHFWVFYSATTNVGFTLTVTDTKTASARSYTNTDLTPAPPMQDTASFPCR